MNLRDTIGYDPTADNVEATHGDATNINRQQFKLIKLGII